MKKTAIATAIILATGVGSAHAITTHTMTNGAFNFYDKTGVLSPPYPGGFSHTDVQGTFDLVNGGGQFTTSTPFSGATWVTDINAMNFHSSWFGSGSTVVESFSYGWIDKTYFNAGFTLFPCRIAGSLDGCADEVAAGYTLFGSPVNNPGYSYSLSPNEFAAHTFFDWSGNDDIPVLAALQVTSGNPFTGPATVVSIDTDAAADAAAGRPPTPGTAMLTSPFPGQTPAFAGTIVPAPIPVPAAVWLFGSGLLGLVGVARRKKA